jgi:SAM-dependent methyltransferase
VLPARLTDALDARVRRLAPARLLRFELVDALLARELGEGPARVLDAGCGEGLFACRIARRHPRWTIDGVDVGDEQLGQARAAARREGLLNVTFRSADVTADIGAGGYDAVAAIECLEEIPDDAAALTTMAAALRPGGLLVVHVPERDWRPVLRGSEATWRHEVRHGYSADELAGRLTGLGLDDLTVAPTSRGVVRAAQELRDRARGRHLALRAALAPVGLAAVRLERAGATWGPGRALLAHGRRAA